MKPGRDPLKKTDNDSVVEPGNDQEGVDFLQVLQTGGGIIAAAILVFLVLRYFLDIV